jgi:hypothetical protein
MAYGKLSTSSKLAEPEGPGHRDLSGLGDQRDRQEKWVRKVHRARREAMEAKARKVHRAYKVMLAPKATREITGISGLLVMTGRLEPMVRRDRLARRG